jgi:Protein of unknown function (DUF2939)
MRRRLALVLLVLAAAVATYAVSPLHAAWVIHDAVRTGDRETLERRVDWPSVRRSLKRSTGEASAVLSEISQAAGIEQPGIWRRIQTAVVPFIADPLIDRYVTAEGAPRLYAWRQMWRQTVRPDRATERPTALSGSLFSGTVIDRAWTVWRRVDRIALHSPLRISVEIRDRVVEGRKWRAVLVLDGIRWRLSELEVLRA